MPRGRAVYSTDKGRLCPSCGRPLDACRCRRAHPEAPVPATVVAVLRLEKSGRAGKEVTVVDGLPDNATFLAELARDLKRACGTGGTAGAGRVELQGDRRERAAALLRQRGFRVKGA